MPKNGNITGEVFDTDVVKQIESRQKFLGTRYKTDQHLIFQNNKNSFLRLASSVNVGAPPPSNFQVLSSEEYASLNEIQQEAYLAEKQQADNFIGGYNQLKDRGINVSLTGMELAKACVLFGGTVGLDDKLNPNTKFGIYNSNEDPISTIAAYGWGGISSRGYVPFPGLDGATVSFYNRGALQKASLKVKVHSLEQLQIFDILYFRIGYTMLLEWGHNVWVDNNEELQSRNEFVTEPFRKFFTEGSSQQDIIKAIQTQRKNDSYNYDAMLGKITNFKWKFNDDGSYDIELNLIGMGDIIESLKVNKSVVAKDNVPLTPSQKLAKTFTNIDAGFAAADKEVEDANKAIETAQSASTEATEKYQQAVDDFNKWAEDYDVQGDIDRAREVAQDEDVDVITYIGNQNAWNQIGGFQLDTSTDLDEAWDLFDKAWDENYDIRQKGKDEDWDLNYSENDQPWTRRTDNIYTFCTTAKTKINNLKPLKAAADAAQGKVEGAQSSADNVKSAADKKKEALTRAKQQAEKEKEILSLSPVTSVENKNKSIFNLELYNWRQNAQAGKDSKNYTKLRMQANSANPDTTGTATLSLDFYYVRIGHLLEWVEKNLLLYDNTKNDPDSTEGDANPIFKIDYNPDTNFCLRFPAQFSADPTVCLIPSKYDNDGISWNVLSNLSAYFVDDDDYKGKLMNIFVNIDHTAGVLDKNIDANGKVNLLKFLTALFNDISDCLGNVNKLEPIFDSEENLLKIIEANGMDDVKSSVTEAQEREAEKSLPMAVFQIYGIGSGTEPMGSFVSDVDFQVQLPPNMAAMATISAQANGNIVGENATGLSKLNSGLTDRLVSVKLDRESIEGSKTGNEDPKKLFNKTIQSVQKEINQLYIKKFYAKDSVSSLRSNNRDIALYLTGNDALENKMPSPFFIPFNLSLQMDGLSGMRNYERFSITEDVLPYSYRSGEQGGVIDFLIKGISHNIDGNSWTTKIETLTVGSNRKKRV